jgi:phosphatidylserine decarboxylase
MEHEPPIMVYNRATGALEREVVLGERFVRLLYERRAGRALAAAVFSRRWFSRLYGRLQDSPQSARKVAPCARALGIDLAEAARREFTSFNDFFTRALAPGVRPIPADPDLVIAPCDARLLALDAIAPATRFGVKAARLDLATLLDDEALAARYAGGTLCLYRLCLADYHRFHFPEACTPGPAAAIAGRLHSVNPIALATGMRILETNLRHRTLLEAGGRAGTVCMLEVGAMCVGSVVQTYAPGAPAARGAEKGMFRFGGSTVIVLYEPGRVRLDADIAERSRVETETRVRLGMQIGRYAR